MQWTGKVIGGVIGLLTLGPFGAALGVVLGHQYDVTKSTIRPGPNGSGTRTVEIGEQFFRTTFRVMGHIAKADGRVSEQEIAAARAVMSELRLTPEMVQAAIECFTEGKQRDFDLKTELEEIQVRAALAGNNMEGPARLALTRTAALLGVSVLELAQIEAVLRIRGGAFARGPSRNVNEQLEQAYRVLECTASSTDEEIRKAYRRQLSRHHPDKLKANGLPESMIEHAKQRTQQIIEAYELIREHRKM
jgi:DnaJ like chaperone protein